MNPRIRELAEQSGWMMGDEVEGFNTRLEKFTELIVGECADIAKHHVMNISTYADAEFVEEQIREHFGVGE